MSPQKHLIGRQVFEVKVADEAQAAEVHARLGAWQAQHLEALIDACCSELSPPDRVHRIGRLEVDLGALDLEELENGLSTRLGRALGEALASKIQAAEREAAELGEDPATSAHIELLSQFARTGTLPFWAEASRPEVAAEALSAALERDPAAVCALARWLAADRRSLVRLARHVKAWSLLRLFESLLDVHLGRTAETRGAELWDLLALSRGAASSVPAAVVWAAALQVASLRDGLARDGLAFFREVLGVAAIEAGVPYGALVTGLHRALPEKERAKPAGAGPAAASGIVQTLWEELRPAPEPPAPVQGKGTSPEGEPAGRDRNATGRDDDCAGRNGGDAGWSGDSAGRNGNGTGWDGDSAGWDGDGTGRNGDGTGRNGDGAGRNGDGAGRDSDGTGRAGNAVGRAGDTAWRAGDTAWRAGNTAWRDRNASSHDHLAPSLGGELSMEQPRAPRGSPVSLLHRDVESPGHEVEEDRPRAFGGTSVPLSAGEASAPDRDGEPSTGRPRGSGPGSSLPSGREVETRGHGASPVEGRPRILRSPAPERPRVRSTAAAARRTPQEQDGPVAAYVDNAGLVLLWPFLDAFFARLGLTVEGRFTGPRAPHRAAGLLHSIAALTADPPEYQLPLTKILCGMPVGEPFDFGPPVTEAEIAERASLIRAVLDHTRVLGDLDEDGLRRAFLLRRGVLRAKDDVYLLAVERAPHDAVLARLPWPLSWVKKPWMEAAVCVEWLR